MVEGLPLTEQIESGAITEYVFLLRAEDQLGAAAHDFITIRVLPLGRQLANFLNVFFRGNFTIFNQNLSAKLDLVTLLASDPVSNMSNTDSIYVRVFRSGSIAVSYTNLSISDFNCADFRAWVETVYVNGSYTETFIQTVFPYQPISTAFIEGPCGNSTTNIHPTIGSTDEIGISFQHNWVIILATLVPTLFIALILLLIGVIAFVMYHRQRPERNQLTIRDTFINRRPVVFTGEAELPYRSRQPAILSTDPSVGGHARPPTALEEIDEPLEEENDSSEEDLTALLLSPRNRFMPPGSPPPPYTLPPDYPYPT